MTDTTPRLTSARLRFDPFSEADEAALAELLADPEITRNVTASGRTPEECRTYAGRRIKWHNSSWTSQGYGVWALRRREADDRLIGWCGFTTPDIEGEDPEVLYGFAQETWGQGLASESARRALAWLFETQDHAGCSALLSEVLNPGSNKVALKLGMTRCGERSFREFLPEEDLAQDVLDYELWRLGEGPCGDWARLVFQTCYRAGQLTHCLKGDPARTEAALLERARPRPEAAGWSADQTEAALTQAFRQGRERPVMDWYHLARADLPPV